MFSPTAKEFVPKLSIRTIEQCRVIDSSEISDNNTNNTKNIINTKQKLLPPIPENDNKVQIITPDSSFYRMVKFTAERQQELSNQIELYKQKTVDCENEKRAFFHHYNQQMEFLMRENAMLKAQLNQF